MTSKTETGIAIVNGARGPHAYFLIEHLLREGWRVHATARPQPMFDLIARMQPTEFYNLAGQSSVSKSFSHPLYTWQTNAEAVVYLLECLRKNSPHTRFYQASSTDMFGVPPDGAAVFNENSALNPQSPYASAKAAAHLLCHSYREVYGLRIASGILSNHESHRRPASFLSRKVVEHVSRLRELSVGQLANSSPLAAGNLKVQRDWGFAPDYVEGMCRILRQIETRAEVTGKARESNESANYRDYVLATGKTHAVWELIDCAFTIGGFDLEWDLEGSDPAAWHAYFRSTGTPAGVVDSD